MIRFESPILLAVGLVLALVVVVRLRRLPREYVSKRRWAVQVAMGLVALLFALALGGLEIGHRADRLAVVFVLDESRSAQVAEGGLGRSEQLRQAIEQMRSDDAAGLVIFGASAATESLPRLRPAIADTHSSVPRDATDIGAGIRRALSDLPYGYAGRVVLVSDGLETRGDAVAAALAAKSRGVSVDVLPIEREAQPEIAVSAVRVPATARPGEPISVRVNTRATQVTAAELVVRRDGRPIARGNVELGQGDDVFVVRDEAPEAGVHRYDAILRARDPAQDASTTNDEGAAFLRVRGASRVLLLADEPGASQALASALGSNGVQVDLRGPREVPGTLAEWAGYDLVVLSDLSSRRLSRQQLRELSGYVHDLGGGLLMLGARHSFGLGGYAHTPVEDALPATFDLRRRRDRLSLAMITAIDMSGSMSAPGGSGMTKLELANEAAARSAALLSPEDRVGVMHVDTSVTWTVPMVAVEDPAEIARRCRRATPGGGGIYVDVTLREAYATLRNERTQLKHFLLFSDGSDSENMGGTRAMVRAAARDGITTSVVSMGSGPDTPELEALSRLGGGRFYIVEDMTELPRIFTQETMEASQAALTEEPFHATAAAPGAPTAGIDFGAAPNLLGHAVITPRGRARVLLDASEEDPLLVTWQYGVGRGAVFTSDAGSEFGRPWLGWAGYEALFSQLARDLARAPESGTASLDMDLSAGRGHVRVEAVDDDGEYRNHLDLSLTMLTPGGGHVELPLRQTGAGRYEADFDADAPGAYLATLREEGHGLVASAGAVAGSGDELRGDATNTALLARVAALTGGELLHDLGDVFARRPAPVATWDPLWRQLLAAAMLLLLLSVALRRLVFPRWRRASSSVAARSQEPAPARSSSPKAAPLYADAKAPDATPAGVVREPSGSGESSEQADSAPAAPRSLAEQLLAKKRDKQR
ncbi:MAG: VWA domain-containing protein [Deltaproteobacteria bacterium]|nr:VWA domain-containing protein [Deltaproteobacteria bacterium]